MRARGDWKRLLALELSAFGFFGLFWGCFAVLLADLSGALGLSPGPLGVALFVGAGASIAAMAALGWTSDRLGRRAYLILVACAFGMGIAGLALSGSYAVLLATLVVLYSSSGLYDVGINAVAVDLERISGRRFMSYLHAAFSGGAMAGAVGAGALLQAGVDYRLVYLTLLLPLATLVAAFAAARFPRPWIDEAPRDERSHSDTSRRRGLGSQRQCREVGSLPQRSAPVGSGDRLPRPSGRGRDGALVGHLPARHAGARRDRGRLGGGRLLRGAGAGQARHRVARRARGQPPHAARLRPADGGRDAARARHHEPRARHRRVPARGHWGSPLWRPWPSRWPASWCPRGRGRRSRS